MKCNNGTCAGPAASSGCCFECGQRAACPEDTRCDDFNGFKQGNCLGKEGDE